MCVVVAHFPHLCLRARARFKALLVVELHSLLLQLLFLLLFYLPWLFLATLFPFLQLSFSTRDLKGLPSFRFRTFPNRTYTRFLNYFRVYIFLAMSGRRSPFFREGIFRQVLRFLA